MVLYDFHWVHRSPFLGNSFRPTYRLARDQSGYNFDFRVRYKVLSRESAVVRYGGIKFEGKHIILVHTALQMFFDAIKNRNVDFYWITPFLSPFFSSLNVTCTLCTHPFLESDTDLFPFILISTADVVPWHNGSSAAHSNSIEDFSNHTALTDRYRQQETNPVNGETKDGNLTTVTSTDAVKDNETYSEPKYYLGGF